MVTSISSSLLKSSHHFCACVVSVLRVDVRCLRAYFLLYYTTPSSLSPSPASASEGVVIVLQIRIVAMHKVLSS